MTGGEKSLMTSAFTLKTSLPQLLSGLGYSILNYDRQSIIKEQNIKWAQSISSSILKEILRNFKLVKCQKIDISNMKERKERVIL